MSEVVERIADAMDSAVSGYSIKLIRLIDGISTYSLTYSDGETVECDSYEAASEHLRLRTSRLQVLAALKMLRKPTEAMLNAARDWSYQKYGKPIGNDAAIGCWQAMVDGLLK